MPLEGLTPLPSHAEIWSSCNSRGAIVADPGRLGTQIVLNKNKRGLARLYKLSYARRRVREARRAADIPEYVSLDTRRHGGLTCYGDAGASAIELVQP